MRRIQERMVDCVEENPERPWQKALVEPERHVTRERITQSLKTSDIDPSIVRGRVPSSTVKNSLPSRGSSRSGGGLSRRALV